MATSNQISIMKNKFLLPLLFFLIFWQGVKAQQDSIPYVILISFDGFRHDYADSLNLPTINKYIKNGAHAEALIPCFPSLTFPNHYSIVTGLYPEHHGIVDNNFFDRNRQFVYHFYSKQTNNDPYYYNGKTIWTLAKEQGIKSASYYWLGSDLPDATVLPDYYYKFGKGGNSEDKIDQVIQWLQLPAEERPHLITVYFGFPDSFSHEYGPWGEKTKESVLVADSLLGDLMKRVDKLNLPVNTIIVSDHGLSELKIKSNSIIDYKKLVDISNPYFEFVPSGATMQIYAKDSTKIDSLYHNLKLKEAGFKVFKKSEFPENWHYENNSRIGDIIVLANKGFYIPRDDQKKSFENLPLGSVTGVHGYDPYVNKDMQGIFYAIGPNVKKGVEIPAFQNIDIYPFIAMILQLELPKIDGNKKTLERIFIEN